MEKKETKANEVKITSNSMGDSVALTVNNHCCVVEFKQVKDTLKKCHFDWIDIDSKGQVEKHHGINLKQCTHVLTGNQYTEKTSVNVHDVLSTEFPIYIIEDKNNKLFSAKSWMAVKKPSDSVVEIKMEMHIRGFQKISKNNRAYLSIKLPAGVCLQFDKPPKPGEGDSTDLNRLELPNAQYNITLSIDRGAVEESEIEVKNWGKNVVVGTLGIFAFEEMVYNVVVIPLVDSVGTDMSKRVANIRKQVDLKTLNEKVGQYFTHLGIKLNFVLLSESDYLTYNSNEFPYKECIDEGGRIKPDTQDNKTTQEFFETVIDKTNQDKLVRCSEGYKGSRLLLVDRESIMIEQAGSQTITTTTEGYAQQNGTICTLFKGRYDDYVVCAHELGHNLGCWHTFEDDKLLTKEIKSDQYIETIKGQHVQHRTNEEEVKEKFEQYLNAEYKMSLDYEHKEFAAYYKQTVEKQYQIASMYYDREKMQNKDIKERLGKKNGVEKVIYTKGKTENVMDYADRKNYFFKWQWIIMSVFSKKHTMSLFFILFVISPICQLLAQTKLDSLCMGLLPHKHDPIYYDHYNPRKLRPTIWYYDAVMSSNWHKEEDTTKSLNTVFVWRKNNSMNECMRLSGVINGWYEAEDRGGSSFLIEAGLSPFESNAMNRVRLFSKQMRTYYACFNEGVPCCTWRYVYSKTYKVKEFTYTDSLYKTVTFDNGLLHGDYVFYNDKDTVYRTNFHHGTGRYKDFYVNGKVMIEGDLINGYRNGMWLYYFYDGDKEIYSHIIVEYYNEPTDKRYPNKQDFIDSGDVKEAIKWERKTPNYKKKKYRNPVLNL